MHALVHKTRWDGLRLREGEADSPNNPGAHPPKSTRRPETARDGRNRHVGRLITQRGQGQNRRRRSANAELLALQRNDCRENIQWLGVGWRRGSYLGLDGRDHAPAHLLAEVQVDVPVPL